jgi:hypothetical protein
VTPAEAVILKLFPRLTAGGFRITSPATADYNCVAWAVDVVNDWYEPGVSWPIPTGYACTEQQLVELFRHFGFVDCHSADLEPGFLKVALYSNHYGTWKHAARQLTSGLWTSKLGKLEDIEHGHPDTLGGSDYGEVFQYMRRPIP